MSSNSAFRRGEGTFSELRRAIAPARDSFSCTMLFHHRGTESALSDHSSMTRLSLPPVAEVDHLSDVMLHVGGALHNHVEAVFTVCADRGVWLRPVDGRLTANCLDHHRDCVVQKLQSLLLRWRIGLGEFASAVTDV